MKEDFEIHSAPLQGITDYTWRNAHYEIFGSIDLYHTPFMRIERGTIRTRDIADISPEHNNAPIIPQIIAGNPDETLAMVRQLQSMGYSHIELNMGCPHPPLAKRHKGSGILSFPNEIEELSNRLSEINGIRYSIKMRLGWDDPYQWKDAIEAIAPITPERITIHPRIGTQQYKGELYMEVFEEFINSCQYPVVFNGELKRKDDIEIIKDKFPNLRGIMIGRGLISDPAIHLIHANSTDDYIRFHKVLLESSLNRMSGGEQQVLSHMKALWEYFLPDTDKRLRKKILKSNTITNYRNAVNILFDSMKYV